MPTIFTRIIAGEIPGQFVFKDALWAAMLDIAPAAPGHVLLVPCAEAKHLAELPAPTLAALGDRLARLTAAVKRATGAPAVNVLVNDRSSCQAAGPMIIPAPTVAMVASSMSMKLPVVRLRRYSSKNSG